MERNPLELAPSAGLVSVVWLSGDAMLADALTKFYSSISKFMETRADLMNLGHRFTRNYGRSIRYLVGRVRIRVPGSTEPPPLTRQDKYPYSGLPLGCLTNAKAFSLIQTQMQQKLIKHQGEDGGVCCCVPEEHNSVTAPEAQQSY